MIVGRKKEQKYLEQAYKANKAQFITVYGRRRVGKTFLIREFFSQKDGIFLHVTGLHNGTLKQQLENFQIAAFKVFKSEDLLRPFRSWREAFEFLTKEIDKVDKKVVLFFDELPWLASGRSGILEMIDFYWNNQWSGKKNIIFIACGSSASWILKKIIYHKGGLHNRTTRELEIRPFTLLETKEFLLECCGISYTDKQVLSLYMAVGGIPFYLEYAEAGLSAAENIQQMLFDSGAPLAHEFHKLFESLFHDASDYIELVRIIASKRQGVSRVELKKALETEQKDTLGGGLTEKLRDLFESGFIHKYLPFDRVKRGEYYRLTDEFCLFYLYWVERRRPTAFKKNHWVSMQNTPEYRAWAGYTFESICLGHVHQIIDALNIQVASSIGSWRHASQSTSDQGAQIDLVIDRDDDAITLCEIKYTDKPFVIDKSYAQVLKRKVTVFRNKTKTEKQIFIALITSNGVKENVYLKSTVHNVVTLKHLFKPT